MKTDYDVVIVGGGMVGATLASALSSCALRLALIEAKPPSDPQQPSYDDRTVALAYGSKRILEGIGLWKQLVSLATPIKSIHVSERGQFGALRMHSHDEGLEALGYVLAWWRYRIEALGLFLIPLSFLAAALSGIPSPEGGTVASAEP